MSEVWTFHLHPEVVGVVVALLGGYGYALRRWGRLLHPTGPAATTRQRAFFVAGVVSLYAALGWPVHDLAERYLYSAHMVQHLLLGFVTPPLLLLGTPRWLGELLLGRGTAGRIYRWWTRPLLAAVVFNAALAIVHWPQVNEVMLASEAFHAAVHLGFLAAALLVWSLLYSPLPEVASRLSPPAKMAYLFAQTLLPTVPASFLTFGDRALYRPYESFPRLWGLSALEDMQLAGLIMKVGGGLLLWCILAVMFFRWANREDVSGVGRSPSAGGGPPVPSDPSPRPAGAER